MKLIDLGKFRRVILWKDDLPLYFQDFDDEVEICLSLVNSVISAGKKIAVELKLPRNSSYYAMLGVEFYPDSSSELKIIAKVKNNSDELYHSAMQLPEKIYLGIPVEYAESIINAAKDFALRSNWIFSGTMIFSLGAHSLVGSSNKIFSITSRLLAALLKNEIATDEPMSDESVILAELDV